MRRLVWLLRIYRELELFNGKFFFLISYYLRRKEKININKQRLPFSLAEFELELLPFIFDNNGACFCILAIIYLSVFLN